MNEKAKKCVLKAGAILTLVFGIVLVLYACSGFHNIMGNMDAYKFYQEIFANALLVNILVFIIGGVDICCFVALTKIFSKDEKEVTRMICDMQGFGWVVVTLFTALPVSILTFLPYVCVTERS